MRYIGVHVLSQGFESYTQMLTNLAHVLFASCNQVTSFSTDSSPVNRL